MAIGDFMHKQLINAASRDALSTIGASAAVGGGAGAVNGLLSDNDTMIGGALSGAMLGAGAGVGLRYAGNKYGAGILAEAKANNETGKFNTNFFTKAGKDEGLDFFGDHSAAMAVHREAANKTADAAPSAGSAVAQEVNKAGEPPVAGPVSSSTTKLPRGTNLVEHQKNKVARIQETQQAIKNADEYNAYEDQLAKMSITNPVRNPTYIHDHSKATASLNLGGSNFSSLGGGWKSLERAENKKTSGNNIPDIKEKALNKYLQNLELKEEANRLTADGYVKNSETGIWSFPPATPATPATKQIKRGKKKK